jgi:hypothetical protein
MAAATTLIRFSRWLPVAALLATACAPTVPRHRVDMPDDVIIPTVRWSDYARDPHRGPVAEFIAHAPFERTQKVIERLGRDAMLRYYLLRLDYHGYDPHIAEPLFEYTLEEIAAAARETLWPIELQPLAGRDRGTLPPQDLTVHLCASVDGRAARRVLWLQDMLTSTRPTSYRLVYVGTRPDRLYCFEAPTQFYFKSFYIDRGGVLYDALTPTRVELKRLREHAECGPIPPPDMELAELRLSRENLHDWIASHSGLPWWAEPYLTDEFRCAIRVSIGKYRFR